MMVQDAERQMQTQWGWQSGQGEGASESLYGSAYMTGGDGTVYVDGGDGTVYVTEGDPTALANGGVNATTLANGGVNATALANGRADATTYANWYKAVYVPAAESDVATQSQSVTKPAKAVKE